MKHVDRRLGLTNILKRLAYSYLLKGLGRHPIEHEVYDEVEVSELYPWKPDPTSSDSGEYGAGVRVSFYRQKKRVRWVEFSIRNTGGGGDEAFFRVK